MESASCESSTAHESQWKVDKIKSLYELKSANDVEEVYDDWAESYDEFSGSLDFNAPSHTAGVVSKYEPNKKARILDAGCGTGQLGEKLHILGYTQVTGVDISQSSLDKLAQKGCYVGSVHSYFGPSSPLNFQDGERCADISCSCLYLVITITRNYNGYFDVVTSSASFLPSHLNEKCLPEMVRLVKKGGYIIISTRHYLFHDEVGDMKVKSGLINLTQEGVLTKIAHDEGWVYTVEGGKQVIGITLVYKVIK